MTTVQQNLSKQDSEKFENKKNEPVTWGEEHFGGVWNTNKKRKQRIIKLANAIKEKPGKSIPQYCDTSYDVKATYNLLKHQQSTPDNLQLGHRKKVMNNLNQQGTYLLIEDDSEFSWSGKDSIEGLGPIGDFKDGRQGFVMHSVIAAEWPQVDNFHDKTRPPIRILGLADQQYYNRVPGKKRSERKQGAPCPSQFKETDPWFFSMDRIGKKNKDTSVKWIRVCDRRADIFEQFEYSIKAGFDVIIRAAQDRALENVTINGSNYLLSTYVKEMPTFGEFLIDYREQKTGKARTANLKISGAEVILRPPQRKGIKRSEQTPAKINFITVKEDNPPEGVEPIYWKIFSSLPINSLEDALTIVRMYKTRWIIEEFHKTVKSGLKAEELQLSHCNRLQATIAIMSIVAISLVEFREFVRLNPDAPAENSNLDQLDLRILKAKIQKEIKTIKDVAMAIGRLGGHMNRKRDGFPGLITLWRGWRELKTLAEGARLVV